MRLKYEPASQVDLCTIVPYFIDAYSLALTKTACGGKGHLPTLGAQLRLLLVDATTMVPRS